MLNKQSRVFFPPRCLCFDTNTQMHTSNKSHTLHGKNVLVVWEVSVPSAGMHSGCLESKQRITFLSWGQTQLGSRQLACKTPLYSRKKPDRCGPNADILQALQPPNIFADSCFLFVWAVVFITDFIMVMSCLCIRNRAVRTHQGMNLKSSWIICWNNQNKINTYVMLLMSVTLFFRNWIYILSVRKEDMQLFSNLSVNFSWSRTPLGYFLHLFILNLNLA